jgi:hypothetical protein
MEADENRETRVISSGVRWSENSKVEEEEGEREGGVGPRVGE